MDKKQEKKIWNSQLAIENPKNDRIAVIYSVKVSSVRILEKPRNPKRRDRGSLPPENRRNGRVLPRENGGNG